MTSGLRKVPACWAATGVAGTMNVSVSAMNDNDSFRIMQVS
jgi:hypothetical protein